METTTKELQLEFTLKEISNILHNQMCINGNLEDLDKSIKIIEQRNINHYPSIIKKIRNFTRVLYEIGAFRNVGENVYLKLVDKLNEIDNLVNAIINDKCYGNVSDMALKNSPLAHSMLAAK